MSASPRWHTIAIILFFLIISAVSLRFGPARRTYISPPRVQPVATTAQLASLWHESGVRGRTLICFTRYLNAVETGENTGDKTIENAMERGIARRVFHVVPDSVWPAVSSNLEKMNGIRKDREGFIGIFDNGRVYIRPLSRFVPPADEKVLAVIEPRIWSDQERAMITALFSAHKLTADLTAIIRGTEQDTALAASR